MTVERFKAEVGADIKEFQRKMQKVDEQIRELALGVDVEIRADIKDFLQDVTQVKTKVAELDASKAEVEIKASLNDFIADVNRVRAELTQLDASHATVEIRAIMNDFKQDMLQAKALAQDLDGEVANIHVKLDDQATNEIIRLLYEIEALGKEKADVKVTLDLSMFYTQLAMVHAELQALERTVVNIKIDIDSATVLADIALIRAQLDALINNAATISVDANTLQALLQLNQINNATKKIPRNIFIKIWVDYTSAMKAYANTVQAFAEAGKQMLTGAFLTLVPVLSQLLSTLVGLIGSLGVMIGVLAGQFMVLASAISVALIGFVGLAAVAIPTIKALFDETTKLNAAQQEARNAWDGFVAVYDNMVKKTEGAVLQAFTSAMQGATKILTALEPMILSVADSMAVLMGSFNSAIDSGPIQKIFDTFNSFGPEIFTNMTSGIGNLVAGLLSLISAFTPAAATWSSGFNEMMASFAAWSDSLSESERFKAFIDYIQTYMPVISKIFGDLIVGIVEFFSAFSGMGGDFMTSLANMTERFREWASALGENQQFQAFLAFIKESTPAVLSLLGELWDLIVNLGVAMAPVGAVVLDLTNKFLDWFNAMLESGGIFEDLIGILPVVLGVITALIPIIISVASVFGNIVAAIAPLLASLPSFTTILWSLFGAATQIINVFTKVFNVLKWLISPVGLVVVAIGLLVGAFVLAYQKVEWFRNLVQDAWTYIKKLAADVFGGIVTDIKSAFTTIVDFAKTQLAKFSGLWDEHGTGIMKIVAGFCSIILVNLTVLMTALLTVIKIGWALISGAFRIAWKVISGILDVAITLILGIVKTGMQILQGDWSGAWETIKQTASDIGQSILKTLSGIIGDVIKIGSDIVAGLVKGISDGFGWVKEKVAELGDLIPDWLAKKLGIHSPSRVMAAVAKWIPAGVAKGITDNLNIVKTATKEMTGAMMPDFSKQVNKASGAYKTIVNAAKETAKANEKLTKETAKVNGKTVTTYLKKTNAERYDAFEQSLADHQKWNSMSAAEERAYWLETSKYLKDGTAAKRKALENANAAQEQMRQEQYQNEVYYIDQAREYGIMSLSEQIKAYETYIKQYKVGSEQQLAYEAKLYDSKKSLYEDLKVVANNYLSEVQSVYDKLADEEQKLRDQYQQTFETRRDTLANTWGLFDEVKLTEMTTYKEDGSVDKQIDLIGNMRQQVNTMSNWMNDIFRLQNFGLNEALMDELQALGPKAAAEINALANMSSQQLSEYEQLWKTKMDLAGSQATSELAGARVEMEKEIVKLRENAVTELEKLKNDMLTEVDEMVNGSTDQFNVLKATLPEIGKKAMQGLIDGFKSKSSLLKSTVQGIANDIGNEMSGILSGERFNATSLAPSLAVASSTKLNTSVYNEMDLAQAPVNVTVNQNWDGDSVKNTLDEKAATNAKINVKKRG